MVSASPSTAALKLCRLFMEDPLRSRGGLSIPATVSALDDRHTVQRSREGGGGVSQRTLCTYRLLVAVT